MRSFLPLSFALLSPLALAQGSVVSPGHFTNAEGPTSNSFPLGTATVPFRYMQIHDDLQGPARAIKGMSFRRNAQSAANPAYSVTLDVWCSTAASTSGSASTTFDANHGANKVQVITNKGFNFPATVLGNVPMDFTFDVPFDATYPFLGTGPLCLEIQKTARTNTGSSFLDAASGTAGNANPPLQFASYGTGCMVTGTNANLTARGASAMTWATNTGILRVNGSSGPPNGLVIVFLGFSNQQAFGSVPLPFLIPGSAAAPSGPCHLYADMTLITAAATSATGTSSTDFPFPATPDLNGIRTFAQILAVDPAANPVGIVTSNGVNHNIVAPYGPIPGCRIYASGNLGPTGTRALSYLLVTRFNL
jgi:hypothetical protein